MGLFGFRKKSSENLRTLTEKEIQEKLYGRFRAYQKEVGITSAEASKTAKSGAIAIADEELSEKDFPLFTSGATKDVSKSQAFLKQEQLAEETKKESPRAAWAKPPEKPEKKNQFFKSAEPSKAQVKQNVFYKTQAKKIDWKSPIDFLKPLGRFGIKFLSILAGFLTALFRQIAVFLSRKQNRYWVGSLCFLSLLLFSIHHLNVKREIAMKEPPRPRPIASASSSRAASPATSFNPAASNRPATTEDSPLSDSDSQEIADQAQNSDAGTASVNEGAFAIQIVTYANQADATQLLNRLKQEGLPCFIKQLVRSGGKIYYTVFVGRFKTYREAQESLAKFQKREIAQLFRDAFIRTLN